MDQAKPKGAGKSSFELINTDILKQMLPIHQGAVILDLACGKGLYSQFLSDLTGPTGLVYAVDLWEEGLQMLEEEARKKEDTNILTIRADATKEIEIDDHSLDLCLMSTVLHDFKEVEAEQTVLKQVLSLLKPGGYLAVIEFKKMYGPPGPPKHIRLSLEETEEIVSGVGFKKINATDLGPHNYAVLFASRG